LAKTIAGGSSELGEDDDNDDDEDDAAPLCTALTKLTADPALTPSSPNY
jgi:hypothetical protein